MGCVGWTWLLFRTVACVFLVVGLLELVVSSWYSQYLTCTDDSAELVVPPPVGTPCPICIPEVREVTMPPLPCIYQTGETGAPDLGDADLTFLTGGVDNVTLERSTHAVPDIVTSAGLSTVAVTSTVITEASVVTTTGRIITSARPTVS